MPCDRTHSVVDMASSAGANQAVGILEHLQLSLVPQPVSCQLRDVQGVWLDDGAVNLKFAPSSLFFDGSGPVPRVVSLPSQHEVVAYSYWREMQRLRALPDHPQSVMMQVCTRSQRLHYGSSFKHCRVKLITSIGQYSSQGTDNGGDARKGGCSLHLQ